MLHGSIMADFNDPEKDEFRESRGIAHISSAGDRPIPDEKEAHDSPTGRSRSLSSSHDTIESDPLEPLEVSLTPDLQTANDHLSVELTYTKTGTSFATTGSRIPSFEVDFTSDDPDNPRNWPLWYRSVVIACVSWATWTVVLYSTSYTTR